MLTPELVDALQAPISEASPCGDDLEYDPAFTALESASQGKPEQQFGDTVIPAVEPDWRAVADQSQALLGRAKDVRAAMLLLRAATRQQGVVGFGLGLDLLTGLLDRYWDGIHPKLDADDDDDPTMRLNALAPLDDETMVLRDLHEALIGTARGIGPLRVRDVAIAHNALATSGEPEYTPAQVEGALASLHAEAPQVFDALRELSPRMARLQALLVERTGRADAIDLGRLRGVCTVLHKACSALAGESEAAGEPDAQAMQGGAGGGTPSPAAAAARGEIRSRQDAQQMLDRVIRYLEQAEPGNPAPLLIARAKKLIGVSFLEIMADLAPGALDTIEVVTGRPPSAE